LVASLMSVGADDYDGDYYASCVLERVKSGMDQSAVATVRLACVRYATPKRCRDKSSIAPKAQGVTLHEMWGITRPPSGPSERELCVIACKDASFYERKFGECSLGS